MTTNTMYNTTYIPKLTMNPTSYTITNTKYMITNLTKRMMSNTNVFINVSNHHNSTTLVSEHDIGIATYS